MLIKSARSQHEARQVMWLEGDTSESTACCADAQRAAKAAQEPVAQPSSAGREPEQDEQDDLLPPEVLAAIAKQSQ